LHKSWDKQVTLSAIHSFFQCLYFSSPAKEGVVMSPDTSPIIAVVWQFENLAVLVWRYDKSSSQTPFVYSSFQYRKHFILPRCYQSCSKTVFLEPCKIMLTCCSVEETYICGACVCVYLNVCCEEFLNNFLFWIENGVCAGCEVGMLLLTA
jgi:hypothetical protein